MGDETNTGGGARIGGDANPGRDFIGRDQINYGTIIHQIQSANLPTPHQIPAPPADFTGRGRELDELRAAVAQGKSIAIVQGQGGIGKTALAYALARQVAGSYPGGQLFIDLQGTQGPLALIPEQALGQVIHSYLPERKLPDGLAELRNLYRSLLGERRVLVLFDNARDAAQVEALLPLPPGCLALVTTRQRVYLPGLFEQHLDALPPADAEALILSIAPRAADCAPALARVCGCLPLALRTTAALLLMKPLLSPPNLLELLKDAAQRLKLTGVEAALSVSYAMLPPGLQEKWRRLAVFAGDFDAHAAAAVWGHEDEARRENNEQQWSRLEEDGPPDLPEDPVEIEAAQDALGELYSYAMLELEDGRCRLHDLARDYATQRMGTEEAQSAQLAHARYFLQILAKADELYLHGGEQVLAGVALFDRERDEITAGQAWAAAGTATERTRLELGKQYPMKAPDVIGLRLHPRKQIAWIEAALRQAREVNDIRMEIVYLSNLGNAYFALGEIRRAIDLYKQAFTISRKTGNRRLKGKTLVNLGNAYFALGEIRRAIDFYKQALTIHCEIGYQNSRWIILNNLGNAYSTLGKIPRAIDLYEQALTIAHETGDRRSEGGVLTNLGNVYVDLGETHRAIDLYEQALVLHRETGDRPGEGIDLGNLGAAWLKLCEAEKAAALCQQALEISRQVEDQRNVGNTLASLGNACLALGQVEQGFTYLHQALQILRDLGDRQGEAEAAWHLGQAYLNQGERARALEYLQIRVDFEREIGHAQAKQHAAEVEAIRNAAG